MKLTNLILPVVALGAAAVLLTPGSSDGYSTIGGSLSQTQRDFRTYNNFTDAAANDNQVAHSQFPGAQGAVMAIWKASVEWGSELHGDGTGDAHQSTSLGSGGANFDVSHQGEATGVGTANGNVHSELSGSSGGVLAFTETPISDGWRIRYYSGWTWHDGPGTSISGIDLQGVACHEYGHALGLGHSTTGSATMYPSVSGSGVVQRSIATDDQNGVQAIYGVKSASKPRITGVTTNSGQITITGTGFDSANNQIWFTQKAQGGNGTPIKVTGLSSNGTTITASIPSAAGPGDVLVRRNSTAHSGLSNSFPSDLAGGGGGTGGAPVISVVTPSSIEAVVVDGPASITLTGTDFTGTNKVSVDGVPLTLFPPQFSIPNDNTLIFNMPFVSKLGTVTIDVTNTHGTTQSTIQLLANASTTVELKNSLPGFLIQGLGLQTVLGGQVGDIVILAASPDLLPTSLPGIVNLAIGNNYSSLFILNTSVIPSSGYANVTIPMTGLPIGLSIHTQGAGLSLSSGFSLPASGSNVQSGTILF
mgnify:CR=1 FL=1|jgi:hypothetical protein